MEYKLEVLKDILKFSDKALNEDESSLLLTSALYQSKEYFTSAALLVKSNAINMDDLLSLCSLDKEELKEYLEPTEETYDYFAKITLEEINKAIKELEDWIDQNPDKYLNERIKAQEKIAKIKALTSQKCLKH